MAKIKTIAIEVEIEVYDLDVFADEYGEPWTLSDVKEDAVHRVYNVLTMGPCSDAFRPDLTEDDSHAVRVRARLED